MLWTAADEEDAVEAAGTQKGCKDSPAELQDMVNKYWQGTGLLMSLCKRTLRVFLKCDIELPNEYKLICFRVSTILSSKKVLTGPKNLLFDNLNIVLQSCRRFHLVVP